MCILDQPKLTLPGKYVLGASDKTTAGDLLDSFGHAIKKPVKYIHLKNPEDFNVLWPKWGEEMGVMLHFWDEFRDTAWAVSDNEQLITRKDLGLDDSVFGTVEDTCQAIDWTNVL
ncbi:hypothetical protein H2198_006747 [Neophaeococcomyces mojaviensis]|uniref:Uncharacterized protein n=1 Tax=Neophaeococcomyces mojaviensis TaxID=3383035 RepID=A0ACC3A241_9EURO|nr:hypothetical protein H2198_006747 [Knufia sp. JES_112]